MAGATVPFQTGHLLFAPGSHRRPEDRLRYLALNLNPNGNLGLIADDYGKWQLDGNILDDTANHPTAPFYDYTFY